MKRLAPILFVDEIEPCLPFWVDRLGFERDNEVPQDGRLVFLSLKKGAVEVMYQTRASLAEDMPSLADENWRSALYIEVDALDPVIEALRGADTVVPERETFYGAREIGVREPGGNIVTFAEFASRE